MPKFLDYAKQYRQESLFFYFLENENKIQQNLKKKRMYVYNTKFNSRLHLEANF